MTQRMLHCLFVALTVAMLAVPAAAQRSTTQPKDATQPGKVPEKEAPVTRAGMAQKLFSDATSLQQNSRGGEAAVMFDSIFKNYPTSELVPQSLAWALRLYYGGDNKKAEELIAFMKKNFPNDQNTVWAYWRPVEAKCNRDSTVPPAEQVQLLEIYLDRYWAQVNFYEAVEMLARALYKANQINDLDAFLTHVLAETDAANIGVMINMIQRACGGRADLANMAAIYGNAAKDISNKEPASMPVRLLEIHYLLRAGTVNPKEKDKETEESRKQRAGYLAEALKKTEAIVRERPKSEHAAYCELQVKPAILATQGLPAEAAKALQNALAAYGIFAMDRHHEKLAEYLVGAGDHRGAAEVLAKLLVQPNWPHKHKEYLDLRHDLLIKLGDVDGANAINAELAKLFPASRAAIGSSLRTVGNLVTATRFDEAVAVLRTVMETCKGDATAAAMIYGAIGRFSGEAQAASAKALREDFINLFPASPASDEARKALNLPIEGSPVAQSKALFQEYQSFAKESNVEAAQRRIERLLKEFPSGDEGLAASNELGAALEKAGKPDLGAAIHLAATDVYPLHAGLERRLRDVAAAFNGASRPEEAMKAYTKLVKNFRYSTDWPTFVNGAAATLDAQNKLDEAAALLEETAKTLGNGPQAVSVRAYMARRLEGQEKWGEAADKMVELLGNNITSPEYRPLIGEALRFIVVAGNGKPEYKKMEAKLLADLAVKYEGWDEADRLRLVLVGSLARAGKGPEAIKLAQDVQKRHPKYEIGAHGEGMARYLSKYSSAVFTSVSYYVLDRVGNDMSGGWGNYLYAHTAEDMIDYALMITQPQAYVDRKKQELAQLIKTKPNRPQNYKSGLPYKTRNIPKPQWHPWPEQRKIYHLVYYIGEGMRRLQPQQTLDPSLWLEVYDLWPHYYLNDERIRGSTCELIRAGDKAGSARGLAILIKQYTKLVWEPYVLMAQAEYLRNHGGGSQAMDIYKTVATNYRDHEMAARAAQAYKDLGGR